MTSDFIRAAGISAALSVLAVPVTGWAAEPPPLAPHKAVYELSMLTSKGSEAPASARGRIVYEFNGNACEGYTVAFRQATELVSAEGRTQVLETRSATYEAGDHKTFRFRIETFADGQPTKNMEGSAERTEDSLSIAIRNPTPSKTDLGIAASFPVMQTFRGLAAARAGETTLEINAYDGSGDGQKVYHSLNIIGKPIARASDDEAGKTEAMKGLQRWPVVASYFDRDKPDGAPIYTLSFEMWDNGVSSNLKLDYGDFILGGKISQFELLKPTPCTPGK